MKTRIVIWGANEAEEKLLIALALNAKENKVDLYTFPVAIATEEFYNLMSNQWRNGIDVEMPAGFTHVVRPLSMTDGLLPDNLKVERTDIILRAQTEWHFVVLSSKLYESYKAEMEEIKEKVEKATNFDNKIWNELKSFWQKVQTQINEQNIFREHGQKLREQSNELFKEMKKFRKQMDDEFKSKSKEFSDNFMDRLHKIEEKIESGLGLQPLFNELKNIQKEYRDTPFTRDDRAKIWDRIDKAFKNVKEKKYGPGKTGESNQKSSAFNRTKKRYDGLLDAIQKMERSIGRDRSELSHQDRLIEQSDGQLEAQIRQAKVKMIEERIRSKEVKLADMHNTKLELEQRMESEKAREDKRAEERKVREVQEKIKEKIAEEMKEKAESLEVDPDKLEKAAEEISQTKSRSNKPSKKVVDEKPIVPTEIVAEKAAQALVETSAVIEKAKEAITATDATIEEGTKVDEAETKTDAEEVKEEVQTDETSEHTEQEKQESPLDKAEDIMEDISEKISDAFQDISDTVRAVAKVVGNKIEEALGEEE